MDSDENYTEELKALMRKANSEVEPSIFDPLDKETSDSWIQRNATMVRLTGEHPFNSEPPLSRLMHYGFITPVPLHYVRNHGSVPNNATWDDWVVEVSGLVERPAKFTMDQLVNDFPTREMPVTLVCAGNRRKEQNMVKQSKGFDWGAAAISTSVWKGVPLRYLLDKCGIHSRTKGALHVCFEGAEDLPGGGGSKYGTSIKREFALDPARDIILAYMQNGERLTPDHGFPVRIVIPGFIGGRMVKWLKRIIVTRQESCNHYHYKDNRVLPSHVDAELADSEAWWYKPEYIITELNINSVITTPCHEEIWPINSWTTQRPYVLRGYAYSGGGRKVTRVEVTLNGGETWAVATLEHTEKPNKYGKYWCWCFWSLEVEVLHLLGAKEIAVRAWDEALNTQPEKLIWNVLGMMNNCWFKVKTNICWADKGEIGIMFEHPTYQNQTKKRHLEQTSESNQTHKKKINVSKSKPSMKTTTKMYSVSEVKEHSSRDSAWYIVHGHVYDCTSFLEKHPGGIDSILNYAGTDCTALFEAKHSDWAKKVLEKYRIGEVQHLTPIIINEAPPLRTVALKPLEKIPCKLVSKKPLTHDVRLFRFALPSDDQVLGLPVGKHISVCATIEDELCIRAYAPTSTVDIVGYFDLVVKIYFKGVKFPHGGLMSQHLDSLPIGSVVEVKGPLGHIEYSGRGEFLVHGISRVAKRLAVLAGGTWITPVYQVAQAILKDPEDRTEMHVVYANRTEDDILLREEMDEWAKKDERFRVWYVVQESKEGWEYSVGFVTEDILREHVPAASDDTLALACGPPPMIQSAVLEKMGYEIIKDNLLVF